MSANSRTNFGALNPVTTGGIDSAGNFSPLPNRDIYTPRQSPRLNRENTVSSLPPISGKDDGKTKSQIVMILDNNEAARPFPVRRKSLKGNRLDFSDEEIVSSCPDLTLGGNIERSNAEPGARFGSASSGISQRSGMSAPCNSPRMQIRHKGTVGKRSPLTLDFTAQQNGNFADIVAHKFKEKQKSARMRDSANSSPVSTPRLRRRNENAVSSSTNSLTSLPANRGVLSTSISHPTLCEYDQSHRKTAPLMQNNSHIMNMSDPKQDDKHQNADEQPTTNDKCVKHKTSEYSELSCQSIQEDSAAPLIEDEDKNNGMNQETFKRCQLWLQNVEEAKGNRPLDAVILPPVQWSD